MRKGPPRLRLIYPQRHAELQTRCSGIQKTPFGAIRRSRRSAYKNYRKAPHTVKAGHSPARSDRDYIVPSARKTTSKLSTMRVKHSHAMNHARLKPRRPKLDSRDHPADHTARSTSPTARRVRHAGPSWHPDWSPSAWRGAHCCAQKCKDPWQVRQTEVGTHAHA